MIGSLNLIGNPAGLLKNIGKGFKDLYKMPKQGFVQGPIEGGLGVIKGAGSLVKQTISGTFQSFQFITDSVASGVSSLSGDQKYLNERDKIRNKEAGHVIEGVGLGLTSLYSGFEQGLTGLVQNPYDGLKKDGVGGLLKGTFKGLTGLILKPVTGVIDLATKTAEGIKNTPNYFDNDKKLVIKARHPRVFYGREKYFQQYNIKDSEIVQFFQIFKQGRFADISLVETFMIYQPDNKNSILILSLEYVVLLQISTKKRIWDFRTITMQKVEALQNNSIRISLSQETKKLKDRVAVLKLENSRTQKELLNKLHNLQNLQFGK